MGINIKTLTSPLDVLFESATFRVNKMTCLDINMLAIMKNVGNNEKQNFMKRTSILFFMFFLSIQVFSQNEITTQRIVKKIDTEFSIDKLYNKKTGEKLSKKDFEKLVNKNLNLPLERVYDNKGNIIKYLYDPENIHSVNLKNNQNEKIEEGEDFPELILRTINGETIKIKDLKGKMVILRMEMEADTFRFKKHEIEELDKAINQTQRKSEIEAIIIFRSSIDEIKNGFDLKDSNFKLIPNGSNFQDKLNIKSFPSTIILNKEGQIMKNYNWSDKNDIIKMLNEA